MSVGGFQVKICFENARMKAERKKIIISMVLLLYIQYIRIEYYLETNKNIFYGFMIITMKNYKPNKNGNCDIILEKKDAKTERTWNNFCIKN